MAAQRDAEVARFQSDNSHLQSALDAQKEVVLKADQTISNLESALKTMGEDAETLKVDHDTKVACLQREKSDLQSELGALRRDVAEDKQRLSLSTRDFAQWMRENSVDANMLILYPDPSTSLSDIHHVLAHNALVKVHSENWCSAYEDAKEVIFSFPIGTLMSTHTTSSLSSLDHQPWVILPRLLRKSERVKQRRRCRYSTSHLETAIRRRAIYYCSSRFVSHVPDRPDITEPHVA